MLEDMLLAVVNAKDNKEKETAYKNLERVGIDRRTANVLVNEYTKTLARKGDME